MAKDKEFYAAAERRIEYLTIGFGAAGAIAARIYWGGRMGVGVAGGAAIAWINYRWLRQGVGTLARLAVAQAGEQKVNVPGATYLKTLGRYVLLILFAYVILHYLKLDIVAMLAGFASNVVAIFVELTGQLVWKREGSQSKS